VRKPTATQLLRQLLEYQQMFKNSGVWPKKKTELSRLEDKRQSTIGDVFEEFENLHAELPQLIASVGRNQDLDKAAFYVGLMRGIFIGLITDPGDETSEKVISSNRVYETFFRPSSGPVTKH
jgi:hypothetical protein